MCHKPTVSPTLQLSFAGWSAPEDKVRSLRCPVPTEMPGGEYDGVERSISYSIDRPSAVELMQAQEKEMQLRPGFVDTDR